jgi:glycosyltransferase involved in cell wall biosynthesis
VTPSDERDSNNLQRKKLIISANAVPLQGGQGLNLFQMIEGAREAFETTVFCREASEKQRPLVTNLVPDSSLSRFIASVPVLRRLRDWQTFFSSAHFDDYVARRLPASDIFQGATGQCAKSLAAAKEKGARTLLDVVTMHIEDFTAEQDRECALFGVRPSISRSLRRRILQEYERADLIRVMSGPARESFLARGFSPERVVAIIPPINPEDFAEAQFDEPKFRVSFVGLIEPWKGFHYLVEAFDALDLPDSELVLWGGTGARPISRYLQERMARNSRIKLRLVDISRFYREVYVRSSVLVHPSLTDGFGYVVAEAMASGIPVIVTPNTGASELVRDGHNGYVVQPRDLDALRDRLTYLAQHPSRLREMGRNARQDMRGLTFEKFRQGYNSCLLRLVT